MIKPRSFLTFQYKLCPRHDTNEKYTIKLKVLLYKWKLSNTNWMYTTQIENYSTEIETFRKQIKYIEYKWTNIE